MLQDPAKKIFKKPLYFYEAKDYITGRQKKTRNQSLLKCLQLAWL